MISADLLERFCGPHGFSRYDLSRPFWLHGYLWATDGRICARMPAPGAEDDVPAEGAKPLPDVLAIWQKRPVPTAPLPPMTGLTRVEDVCCDCAVPCSACDGNGCEHCQGDGWVHKIACERCHGRGQYRETVPSPQPIGAAFLAGRYAALLHELEAPVTISIPAKATEFIGFAGGLGLEGVVAGVRIPEWERSLYVPAAVDAQPAAKE